MILEQNVRKGHVIFTFSFITSCADTDPWKDKTCNIQYKYNTAGSGCWGLGGLQQLSKQSIFLSWIMCSTRNTKHKSRGHMVIILTRTCKKQELLSPSPFCGLLVFVFVLFSSFVFVCVRPILSVSLGCSFLIDPSDFSYVYYRFRNKTP